MYFLLFNESKDAELWKSLLEQYNKIEQRLPIFYYRPFKIAAYFIQHAFTKEQQDMIGYDTFTEFKDRFYDPEQIYDYVKTEKHYNKDKEFDDLHTMIRSRLFLFPLNHVIYDNMFVVHECWENRKVGLNLWLDRHLVPKTNNDEIRVNKKHLLHSKMMKYDGWVIQDVTWRELINLGSQVGRDKYIHNWFHTESLNQEKKGVFKRKVNFI